MVVCSFPAVLLACGNAFKMTTRKLSRRAYFGRGLFAACAFFPGDLSPENALVKNRLLAAIALDRAALFVGGCV
jgi:hypothetical protein